MSGEHFSGGTMPHESIRFLSDELMTDVERNVVYACTDVTLRDKATGKIFLGMRQTEPQLGPWFIGGRDRYAAGINENAAIQVKGDLHMELPKNRFNHISTYSTDFPVAAPGKEDHGRHTKNAVMCIDLDSQEVAALNNNIETGNIRDEYSTGAWYDPSEIAKPDSDFPDVVKQFVRDLYGHDMMMKAIHDEANRINSEYEDNTSEAYKIRQRLIEQMEQEREQRLKDLENMGFDKAEAEDLDMLAGPNASYATSWARTELEKFGDENGLRAYLEELLPDQGIGDFQLKKMLKAKGITPPEVYSDNSPILRSILTAAARSIEYNQKHEGKIFGELKQLHYLGRAGMELEDLPPGMDAPEVKAKAKDEEIEVEKEVTFKNYPEKFGLKEENVDDRRAIYSISNLERFLEQDLSPDVPEDLKAQIRTLFDLYPNGLKQLFRKTNADRAELAKHYHTPAEVGGTGDEVFFFTNVPEGSKVEVEQYDFDTSKRRIRYGVKSGDVVVNKPHTYHVFRIDGPVSFVQVMESPDFKPDDLIGPADKFLIPETKPS